MGAFMIFDIEFEREKDRKKFEEKYELTKKNILVDEGSNSFGFVAYLRRNEFISRSWIFWS